MENQTRVFFMSNRFADLAFFLKENNASDCYIEIQYNKLYLKSDGDTLLYLPVEQTGNQSLKFIWHLDLFTYQRFIFLANFWPLQPIALIFDGHNENQNTPSILIQL